MTGFWFEITLLFICLVGSGFFSGIETGVVSINSLRLHHMVLQNIPGALRIKRFIDNPDYFFGTTLIGTNLCNVAFPVIAANVLTKMLGSYGSLVAGVFTTFIILIFGEYLPKAWFQSRPARRSMRFAALLDLFGKLFRVISIPLVAISRVLVPIRQGELSDQVAFSREDIVHLFSARSGSTPTLSKQERVLMMGVLALSEKTAGEIMFLRKDMRMVKEDAALEDVLDALRSQPADRVPVQSREGNRIIGILNVLEFLHHAHEPGIRLRDYLRQPQFVREGTYADELIPRMRLNRQPFLLVRNELGEITGYVTTELVLDQIASPLYQRSSVKKPTN